MKNQKQTIRKIVGFLNDADEDGGFWLPNIQRPFVWRALSRRAANCSGRFDGLLASNRKSRLGGGSWSSTIRTVPLFNPGSPTLVTMVQRLV